MATTRRPGGLRSDVRDADDVFGQNRHQRVDVTGGARRDELLGDAMLCGAGHVEPGRIGFTLHTPASPTGELATRRGRASDDGRDGVKRELEDVVENEHGAFGRGELFEYDEQRHAHTLVEGD